MILFTKNNTGIMHFIEVTKVKVFSRNQVCKLKTKEEEWEQLDMRMFSEITLDGVNIKGTYDPIETGNDVSKKI